MTPSPELRERILRATASAPSPDRSALQKQLARVGAASVALAVALFFACGGLAHSDERPFPITAAITAGSVLLFGIAAALGIGRGRSSVGRSDLALALLVALAPLAVLGWLVLWHGAYPAPSPRVGVRCFFLALGIGTTPLLGVLFARRNALFTNGSIGAAAIGTAAGAFATVFVDAWCPRTDVGHVLVGHVAPIVTLAIVGAVAARLLSLAASRARTAGGT